MITSKHFKEIEFQRTTPSCSLQDMKQSTMNKLDAARDIAGVPFVINSAFRTIEHEKRQGRAGTSSHTTGRAVDIRCNADSNRFKIIDALIKSGFNRIGVHKTFIHADDSETHTKNVIWFY